MIKVKYSVYQLKKTDEGMKLLHLTYKDAEKKLKAKNYEKVWDSEIEYEAEEDPVRKVASELGKDLPQGFYGHMISVSDIIVINDEEAYYVDATGYKNLPIDFVANLPE